MDSQSLHVEGADQGRRAFDAYIPLDRRIALVEHADLPDRTSGAVLFADMSGFSTLTESLAEELGPGRGAEELSKRVDAILGCVIGQVQKYGGSIIGFAGDGVTGWFDQDKGQRATAAALAAQRMCGPNTSSHSQTSSTMPNAKYVVTTGLARRFLVGHPRIQRIDVVAGGIVDRVSGAEHLAKPGDVVVGSEVLGRIREHVEIVDWRQSEITGEESFAVITGAAEDLATAAQVMDVPELDREVARDWLLPAVLQRLERGEGEFVSEMRQAVSLFLQFSGIQYDLDNDAHRKLDAYVRWVQTELAKYEAFLLELILGDKGSYFYASFGAPISHEDDAARALRVAETLRNVPPELSFIENTRIGVSQGKMFAGTYGGVSRKTYGLLGSAANVAARLMERAAPGQILLTPDVAAAASDEFDVDPIGGVTDDANATQAVALVGRKLTHRVLVPKSAVETKLVGRLAEQELLADGLDRLLDGQSDLLFIEGPAGIGKSRLLVELTERADRLGISTLVGAGNGMEQNTPLYAWRPVFQKVLGLTDDADEESVRTTLESRLTTAPELLPLLPLLNPVLPVNLTDTEPTMRMSPEARSQATVELMLRCLAQPVGSLNLTVLILDDVQWLDSASWTLLDAARRNLSSLLIVLSRRVTQDSDIKDLVTKTPDALADVLIARRRDVIELEPLSADEIGVLIQEHLAVVEIPRPLLEVIAERAEGNPFFAQELVESLLQRGLIAVENDHCRLIGSIDELRTEVPERIEKLLTSRLDQLPLDQQTTLVVASVLGREFTLDELLDVAPPNGDASAVSSRLSQLVKLGFLAEGDKRGSMYRFRHGLTHEAAAQLLPPTRRQGIHARAATWIESNNAKTLSDFYPALAQHWDAAGNVPKALHYLDAAAEEAALTSAYDEAIAFYSRALDIAQTDSSIADDRVARWHLRLGETYVNRQREDVTHGRVNLEAGLRRLREAPPRGQPGAVVGLLWQLLIQVWNRATRRHVRVSKKAPNLREASRAYERLVELYFIGGKSTQSLYAALRTLNLADAAGPSPEWTRGMATVGAIIGFVPIRRLAEWYLQQSLDSITPDAPAADAWATLAAGFYYTGVGDWERSEELLTHVTNLARRIRDTRRLEDGLTTHCMQAYLQGDLERSLELGDELCATAEARASDRPLAYCLGTRAYAALETEPLEQLETSLMRLEEIQAHPSFPDQALIDDRHGLQALLALRKGEFDRALELADEVLARASGPPSNFAAYAVYGAPAEVYLTVWRERGEADAELRRKSKASIKALKRYARVFPVGRPRLHWWRAVMALNSGQPNKAAELMGQSTTAALNLRMRPLDG